MKHIHIFWGKVKNGQSRGRKLGFPTANIALHKKIPEGIYASEVTIRHPRLDRGSRPIDSRFRGNDKECYQSATFIGVSKTFSELDYKAESYILNFNQNIYGKWLTVRLFKKLRENKKFDSEKGLVEQMDKDILATRKFFETNRNF